MERDKGEQLEKAKSTAVNQLKNGKILEGVAQALGRRVELQDISGNQLLAGVVVGYLFGDNDPQKTVDILFVLREIEEQEKRNKKRPGFETPLVTVTDEDVFRYG